MQVRGDLSQNAVGALFALAAPTAAPATPAPAPRKAVPRDAGPVMAMLGSTALSYVVVAGANSFVFGGGEGLAGSPGGSSQGLAGGRGSGLQLTVLCRSEGRVLQDAGRTNRSKFL